MIETYLTKVNKEELQNVSPLNGVSKERTPYLVYKQYRYAYITEDDCLVTRQAVTYPQLKSILAKRKEGFIFTLEESDALTELLNIPAKEVAVEEMVPVAEPEQETTEPELLEEVVEEEVEKLTDRLLAQEGFVREGVKFEEEIEKERVDVSVAKPSIKKKQTRKKKNQA